ncbi:MAG: ATP-binding protein [bacterium]|nr:ATP-binding protein [bacterium]
MIGKQIDKIEKADLDSLQANEVPESRTLDYKQSLPGNSDDEKREFLADISSFANASGGDIIYGVVEKRDSEGKPTGIPEAVNGLAGINVDAEILRLTNIIRDSIEPRINGVEFRPIDGFSSGPIIVCRIPKSWASPHMVTYKGSSRFYARDNRGKYPLDVTQIRSAFTLSSELPERIRRFRDDRLAKIIARETPVALTDGPMTVLHVLPVAALDPVMQIDISDLIRKTELLVPIHHNGWTHRYNFDGFLTYTPMRGPELAYTYLQIFRSGALEAVNCSIIREVDGKKIIPATLFDNEIIKAIRGFLEILKDRIVPPPFFIMLSLIGVTGFKIGTQVYPIDGSNLIDRDILLLPDLMFDSYSPDVPNELKPVFDSLWQAAGWSKSYNYNDKGIWTPQP